ncbi:DUF969 family protein [Metallibacterium sp.]|uniref:DUF969 domain-containing protein n=1 Tax=Metallibacterium sp. TaxID=2940281 RepID=UPI002618F2FF|nr:DUF969 family protein [Metallibacterium sp.]
MNAWPLLGVALVVLGFARRWNPVPVVVAAGVLSGLLAGYSFAQILALLGNSFVSNRALLLYVLTLPAIGLLERAGLREHAQRWIERLHGLTLSRLLIGYLGLRQIMSMLGLTNVAGQAQTVRPLLAPMAEAAAMRETADADAATAAQTREQVRALAAATDNIGLFFGEDVFIALGAVLLIHGFYVGQGIDLHPLHIALWALPTAIAAFVIHAVRVHFATRTAPRRARTTQAGDDHAAS